VQPPASPSFWRFAAGGVGGASMVAATGRTMHERSTTRHSHRAGARQSETQRRALQHVSAIPQGAAQGQHILIGRRAETNGEPTERSPHVETRNNYETLDYKTSRPLSSLRTPNYAAKSESDCGLPLGSVALFDDNQENQAPNPPVIAILERSHSLNRIRARKLPRSRRRRPTLADLDAMCGSQDCIQ